MRVLIDARMYGLENTGIGRYIINLTEELKKLTTDLEFTILLRKVYFDVLKFPENWKKVLADFPHYTFEEQIKLPKLIEDENPDIVHFPHINFPILYRGKFVVTVHDMTMFFQGTNATSLPLYKYIFKRIPFKYAFRKAVLNSSRIITPSKTVKKEIVNYFKIDPKKITVTYEGYNTKFVVGRKNARELEILTKYQLTNKDYFFYVGNAYPHKNLKLAVSAVKKINEMDKTKIKFIVAGSRDIFIQRFENLIEGENAKGFVEILGYIPDNELAILYKNSISFVYPSLSEGFGLQGLEAMASGCLVMASDIPVFREIYKDNALYFDPQDVDSLIKIMKTVIKMSDEERAQRIDKARRFIARYSWQKMAKQTLNVYKGFFKNES